MDLERIKKLSDSKVKAGNITKQVRNAIKEYKGAKQDIHEGLSETFKPIVDVQKETKRQLTRNRTK